MMVNLLLMMRKRLMSEISWQRNSLLLLMRAPRINNIRREDGGGPAQKHKTKRNFNTNMKVIKAQI